MNSKIINGSKLRNQTNLLKTINSARPFKYNFSRDSKNNVKRIPTFSKGPFSMIFLRNSPYDIYFPKASNN